MCGITGFWSGSKLPSEEAGIETLRHMMVGIRHRGPDMSDTWADPANGVFLGHQRLSIVDLSPAGAQPMTTRSGRFVIIYNGELYNTVELRDELVKKGISSFRGHSDTEVLIEHIEAFGVAATLPKLNGLFAFAVYDRQEKIMTLARDQLGIKPLFWSFRGGTLIFGSELKTFHKFPGWNMELNMQAVAGYFSRNYIQGPRSIYANCHKLLPGHYLTLSQGGVPLVNMYWSVESRQRPSVPKCDLAGYFETLLTDAVKRQMVADVPLGVFLSGGIDSSLIASLMQKNATTPIRTFTIGFEEDAYNEAYYAREVSKILGAQHSEAILSLKQAIDLIPSLPEFYDEPFADSSQLPTMLLSRMARKDVTVCLSGDGGDELFLGYKRYFNGRNLFGKLDMMGHVPLAADIMESASHLPWHIMQAPANMDLKLKKMAYMTRHKDIASRYDEMISLWPGKIGPVQGRVPDSPSVYVEYTSDNMGYMRAYDIESYLPDDILQKTDRASMAYALEVRVPFLDIRVVESALQVPHDKQFQWQRGKVILRDILAKYIPRQIFERPKSGFSVPIGAWLRHDLRDMAETYLSEQALNNLGFLDTGMIRTRWKQHLAGTHDWNHSLWGVLMFQLWHQKYKA